MKRAGKARGQRVSLSSQSSRFDGTEDDCASGQSIRQPNLLVKMLACDPKLRDAAMKFRKYPAGELLFQQGDRLGTLYVIKSGIVRTYYTAPSGREITLAYWKAGDLVGADRIYEGGVFRWSGQTTSVTEVYAISASDMRGLMLSVPELAVAVLDALSFKLQWLSSLIQMLGTESVSRRLAFLLDTLCDLYGTPTTHGTIISAPFTHEDLARMVGASRQWVTIALARFQERGVLKVGKRRIEVLRRECLSSTDMSTR